MTRLAHLQQSFQTAILNGDSSFAEQIRETGRIPAATRIAIYADAYRLRLIEVLQDNYPGLHRLLGDDAFDRLARDYIDANPSGFRSVRWFGDALPSFIAARTGERNRDVMRDLALSDWNMTLAFDAADIAPATEADMAGFAPEVWGELVFDFHPSVRRLNLHCDALRFRNAEEHDIDGPPEKLPHAVAWIIWRQELAVQYRSLDVDEAFMLDAAISGENFAVLCAGMVEWIDEEHAPMRAAGFLKRWLLDGLIAQVRLPAQE